MTTVNYGDLEVKMMASLSKKSLILLILKSHHLIKLREKVKRVFVIGSFARGEQNAESDFDVLLEVEQTSENFSEQQLSEYYRRPLQQYFVTNKIYGKCDAVHPQWEGRRMDVYFTYDADKETRPKIELKD